MSDEKLDVRLNRAGNTTIGIKDMAGHISPWVLEEYAPRLVAAWNACAGAETEALEDAGEGFLQKIIMKLTSKFHDEKARADAAEALLRDVVTVLDSPEMAELWGECLHLLGGYSGPTIDVDAIRAFLAETAPKPVRLGDEVEI